MRRKAKIACSVDADLLARVERLRAGTGESRSAVISRALARLTEEEAHQARVRRYREVYLEQAESVSELEAVRALARAHLRHLTWEDE